MRVLGIDPGSHRTGWGVVEAAGSRLLYEASGVLTGPRGDVELADRLCGIADGLEALLDELRPDAVAVETLFAAKNFQSALTLGHARGVALLCVARRGVPLFEYAPAVVKRATTGSGRAPKDQVQRMVQLLLGRPESLALDASDALAVAICHCNATPGRLLLAAVGERR